MPEPLFKHPHVSIFVTDLSQVFVAAQGFTTLYCPAFTQKGEDNKLVAVNSVPEYIDKYGEPNGYLYGQPVMNISEWLIGGGEALVMRLLPDDATLAHAILVAQTKEFNVGKVYHTETGIPLKYIESLEQYIIPSTDPSTPTTPYADDLVYDTVAEAIADDEQITYDATFKKVAVRNRILRHPGDGARNASQLKIYMDQLQGYLNPATAMENHVLGSFYTIGRGSDYYNDLQINLSIDNAYDDTYSFRVYVLEIYKTYGDGLTLLEGPFRVSFDPEAMDNTNESLFIKDVLDKYGKEVKYLPHVVGVDPDDENSGNYEGFVSLGDALVKDDLLNPGGVAPGLQDFLTFTERNTSAAVTYIHYRDTTTNGVTRFIEFGDANPEPPNVRLWVEDSKVIHPGALLRINNDSNLKIVEFVEYDIEGKGLIKLQDETPWEGDLDEGAVIEVLPYNRTVEGVTSDGISGADQFDVSVTGALLLNLSDNFSAYKYNNKVRMVATLRNRSTADIAQGVAELNVKLSRFDIDAADKFTVVDFVAGELQVDDATGIVEGEYLALTGSVEAVTVYRVANIDGNSLTLEDIDGEPVLTNPFEVDDVIARALKYVAWHYPTDDYPDVEYAVEAEGVVTGFIEVGDIIKIDRMWYQVASITSDDYTHMIGLVYEEQVDGEDVVVGLNPDDDEEDFAIFKGSFTEMFDTVDISGAGGVTVNIYSAIDRVFADGSTDLLLVIDFDPLLYDMTISDSLFDDADADGTIDTLTDYDVQRFEVIQYKNELTDGSYTIDYSSDYIELGKGNNGFIRTTNNLPYTLTQLEAAKKQILVKAYLGEINEDVLCDRFYPFDVTLDAKYPKEVKDAMNTLASVMRQDHVFICDTNFTGHPEQAIAYRRTLNYNNFYTSIFTQDAVVYDRYSGKNIRVTAPYFLAQKMPFVDRTKGIHWPFVGPRRGELLGYKNLSWHPTKAWRERLYNAQVNYIEVTPKRTCFMTGLTSQTVISALSNTPHVRALLRMKRDVRELLEDYIQEFINEETLGSVNYNLNQYLQIWINNGACTSIAGTVYASEYDMKQKLVRVRIEIQFTPILERFVVDMVIPR
jgi:hypothetical protein